MLAHLSVELEDLERRTGLLDDWTWLIGPEKRPLLLTAAGDAFVQDVRDEIARQIADLPEGAPITKLDLKMPKKKPWWKFW